jgi:hypothetical protein
MLNHLNHWIEFAGTATDALLLLRILQLRLQKTYLFITLASLLTLFFDVATLWPGLNDRASLHIVLYSRFLYLFLYPAAAYDVWEEAKPQIEVPRKFAAVRMVGSLTLTSLFGLILAILAGSEGSDIALGTFAVIVWAASATASLAFLWSVRRLASAHSIPIGGNTSVWRAYYQFLMAGEVGACFLLIVARALNQTAFGTFQFLLNAYEILIALWCVWRLRGIPSDVPSAPENANS